MKQRAVEILFRHKLLILLPLLVIMPIMVWLALQPSPATWQSSAVLWVDEYKPLAADERLGYTPGKSQQELLSGFIASRTFARSVLQQTLLAPALDAPRSEERALRTFWASTSVTTTNNTFARLVVQTSNAELSYQIASGVLENYQTELRNRADQQSKAALAFYGDALARSSITLDQARTELAAYIAAHPELAGKDGDAVSAGARQRDTTYAKLFDRVDSAQRTVGELGQRYGALQTQGAAALQGQQLTLVVVDRPELPQAPFRVRRLAKIQLPLLGLVAGVIVSAGIATMLVITSRALFGPSDTRNTLGLPVVGEIPVLRRRRWPWQRVPRDAVRIKLWSLAHPRPSHSAGD